MANASVAVSGLVFVFTLLAGAPAAYADCDCGSTDPNAPCTGTSVTRTHAGLDISFAFHCEGSPCQCDRFVTGSYWVATVDESGTPVSAVTVTGATPGGEDNSMEVNPADGLEQGMLSGYSNYRAEGNLMNALPYAAAAGDCIKHGGDPMTDGRWSSRHGEAFTILQLPWIVDGRWDTLRDCADPSHPSYPCAVADGGVVDSAPFDAPCPIPPT